MRVNAVHALGEIKDRRAVPALIEALKNKDLKHAAVNALGNIKDSRAVPELIIALKDEGSAVRESAARALGRIKDPTTIDVLIKTLKDAEWNVRVNAVWALSQFKVRAIPALIEALNDKNELVREGAASALGRTKNKETVTALRNIAYFDMSEKVRVAAKSAIEMITGKK